METPAYPVRISSRANATKAADGATAAVAVHLTRCCDGGLAAHLLSALVATTEQRIGAMYLSDCAHDQCRLGPVGSGMVLRPPST